MFDINNLAEFKGQIIDVYEDFCEKNNIRIKNPDKEQYDKEAGYAPGENAAIIFGDDYDTLGDLIEEFVRDNNGIPLNEQDELTQSLNEAFLQILIQRGVLGDIGLDLNNLYEAWRR